MDNSQPSEGSSGGTWFQRYVMPGLVFESVVIGGGYATGRELVEFFLKHGPVAGILGMCLTFVVWGIVLATTFEFARISRSFDYRTFFRSLLGPAWFIFEVLYVALLILVLSVVGAAAGALVYQSLHLPPAIGSVTLMLIIAFVVYFGSSLIERILSAWAMLLYGVFAVLVAWCFTTHGRLIVENLSAAPKDSSWIFGGIIYAGYNIACAPSVLFCLRYQRRRREAIVSGLLGGVLAIAPGMFLLLSMLAFYPAIQAEPVPSVYVLGQIQSGWFQAIFEVVLFGTLVKTGIGLLHAINERVAVDLESRNIKMPRWIRTGVAVALLIFAISLANRIGIVNLIAKGYGTLSYGFVAIYVIPVMTIGIWRILVRPAASVRS